MGKGGWGVHFRSLFAQFPFIIQYLFLRPARPHYLFSLLTQAIHPICCENSGPAVASQLPEQQQNDIILAKICVARSLGALWASTSSCRLTQMKSKTILGNIEVR